MIQYRHGVFETNSSSSHSIVVSAKDDYYTKEEIEKSLYWKFEKDGLIEYWSDDDLRFGRYPFDILNTFAGKLRYVIAAYGWDDKIPQEIYDVCREMLDGFKGFKFPFYWDERDERVEFHGDIDHQSCTLLKSFLEKNNITIREFLLNRKYIVIIDGDEYNTFERLLSLDFIDHSKIDKIYGIYGEMRCNSDSN